MRTMTYSDRLPYSEPEADTSDYRKAAWDEIDRRDQIEEDA